MRSDALADFAMRNLGETKSWECFLTVHTDLSADEIAKIHLVSTNVGRDKLSQAKLKYSLAQIQERFESEVSPVLQAARKTQNWDLLLVNRWKDKEWYSSVLPLMEMEFR
jgi:hypothetical protein